MDEEDTRSLTQWLLSRAEARSERAPSQSVVFDQFPPESIVVPAGYASDYFGVPWPEKFGFLPAPGAYISPIPPVSEEYFEFIDVFESVNDGADSFTMLEWGAGFGRWTGLAVGAAKRRNISQIKVSLVEAEPVHASWIAEYMQSAGLTPEQWVVEKVALSNTLGSTIFITGMPTGNDSPSQWYGQAIDSVGGFQPNGRYYHGVPEHESPGGWRGIRVPLCPASKLVSKHRFIDLIDMDLQGAEADVVEECIDLLDGRVRRLHIGTHAHDIEERLRRTLMRHHWILIRDIACLGSRETSFGPVECVDGVQSWFNPRFPPPGWSQSREIRPSEPVAVGS
jgi:FkbM family methyltransferase